MFKHWFLLVPAAILGSVAAWGEITLGIDTGMVRIVGAVAVLVALVVTIGPRLTAAGRKMLS